MNKVLIVDASESDRRLTSSLLTRAGYEPITVDSMEVAKEEVAKLPPGAVVVTAMKFAHGTAQEQAHKLHYTCKCQAKNPYAECTGINIFKDCFIFKTRNKTTHVKIYQVNSHG